MKFFHVAENSLTMFSGIDLCMEFYNALEAKNIDVTFEVSNQDEILVFHNGAIITKINNSRKGVYQLRCGLPEQFLNAGTYSVSVIFGESQRYVLYQIRDLFTFEVLHEMAGSNASRLPGVTFPKLDIESSFKEYFRASH